MNEASKYSCHEKPPGGKYQREPVNLGKESPGSIGSILMSALYWCGPLGRDFPDFQRHSEVCDLGQNMKPLKARAAPRAGRPFCDYGHPFFSGPYLPERSHHAIHLLRHAPLSVPGPYTTFFFRQTLQGILISVLPQTFLGWSFRIVVPIFFVC